MALPLDELKVIDADTHMTEQHDLWTSHAPAALQGRVPQVVRLDGMACWCVDGAILGYMGRTLRDESPVLSFPNGLEPREFIFGADRVIDGELYGRVTPERFNEIVSEWERR